MPILIAAGILILGLAFTFFLQGWIKRRDYRKAVELKELEKIQKDTIDVLTPQNQLNRKTK